MGTRMYLYFGLISTILSSCKTTKGTPVRIESSIAFSTPFLCADKKVQKYHHYQCSFSYPFFQKNLFIHKNLVSSR